MGASDTLLTSSVAEEALDTALVPPSNPAESNTTTIILAVVVIGTLCFYFYRVLEKFTKDGGGENTSAMSTARQKMVKKLEKKMNEFKATEEYAKMEKKAVERESGIQLHDRNTVQRASKPQGDSLKPGFSNLARYIPSVRERHSHHFRKS